MTSNEIKTLMLTEIEKLNKLNQLVSIHEKRINIKPGSMDIPKINFSDMSLYLIKNITLLGTDFLETKIKESSSGIEEKEKSIYEFSLWNNVSYKVGLLEELNLPENIRLFLCNQYKPVILLQKLKLQYDTFDNFQYFQNLNLL